MDSSNLLFWGVELIPGASKTLELSEGECLNVNSISLGENLADKNGRSVVYCRPGEEAKRYALCVLSPGKTECFHLGMTLMGEEKYILEVSGKNSVHLVGNFECESSGDEMFGEGEEGDGMLIDQYSDSDSSISDSDDSDVDESESDMEPMLLPDDDPPVITELLEVDSGVKSGKQNAGKKGATKGAKKIQKTNKADDDDSDEGTTGKNASGKPTTPKPSPGSGKKRTRDAGQTPANKKARAAGSSGGAGPSSAAAVTPKPAAAPKPAATPKSAVVPKSASKAKPAKKEKETNGATPDSSKKGKGASAKKGAAVSEEKPAKQEAGPSGGKAGASGKKKAEAMEVTPAEPVTSAANGNADGESSKKKKRRRKSKGGGGPSSS